MSIMPARTDSAHHLAPPPMLAAALDAVARGWALLPCHPRGPRAKAPIGDLVPHGHHDASADPDVVRAWWTRAPGAMIGAAVPPTLLVLDLDPRNGGSVAALTDALGALPVTLTAWSGRGDGGRHLYYYRPPGPLVATALPPGVDLKVNGYTILPPSLHPATGRPYRWHLGGITHLPAQAVAALRPRPPRLAARRPGPASSAGAAGLVRTVATAAQGSRNAALYWAACRAVEHHGPEVLDDLADAAAAVGLAEREITATLASARRTLSARR